MSYQQLLFFYLLMSSGDRGSLFLLSKILTIRGIDKFGVNLVLPTYNQGVIDYSLLQPMDIHNHVYIIYNYTCMSCSI